jgi:4-hydroxy-L-threonine phosphate dehydrogenase PdxA
LSRPLLAIVIGDPSGVGPEVCVKALATGEPQALARFGERRHATQRQ